MGIGLLRKTIDPEAMTAIWAQTYTGGSEPGRACAICLLPMVQVAVELKDHPLDLDVCKKCEFVWFDAGEFEVIPPPPAKPRPLGQLDEAAMSPAAREALALAQVREIAEQAHAQDPVPDRGWKTIPALLGLPVEMDSVENQRIPWATFISSGLIAAISMASFLDLKNIIERWGLIPAEVWRHHGLTLLTSFFLHGGWVHLLGNLYFLILFGGHVERYLGWWRWLGLLLLATLTGDLLHIVGDPRGTLPCIGASGGISGLMTFYALKFPHAQLGILFRWYFYFRWIRLPAWSAFCSGCFSRCGAPISRSTATPMFPPWRISAAPRWASPRGLSTEGRTHRPSPPARCFNREEIA